MSTVTPDVGRTEAESKKYWARVRLGARIFFALICFGLALAAGANLGYYINDYKRFGSGGIRLLPYNEPVKAGIAHKIDGAKSLLQVSLLAFGALWGMILVKKDERRISIRDLPELWMFLVANFCFAVSWVSFDSYMEAMGRVQVEGQPAYDLFDRSVPDANGKMKDVSLGVMDFRSPRINNFVDWQASCLLFGVISAGLALFSVHVVKGDR